MSNAAGGPVVHQPEAVSSTLTAPDRNKKKRRIPCAASQYLIRVTHYFALGISASSFSFNCT